MLFLQEPVGGDFAAEAEAAGVGEDAGAGGRILTALHFRILPRKAKACHVCSIAQMRKCRTFGIPKVRYLRPYTTWRCLRRFPVA